MTVANQTRRVRYEGNGSATSFTYDFRIFKSTDLMVTLTSPGGQETILSQGIDFTVTGAGSENGGEVRYPTEGDPLPAGHFLTIVRNLPYTQETDIQNQGAWLPEVVESALDRLTMQNLQLLELSDRTLRYPVGSAGGSVEVPAPGGASLLGFNGTGGIVTYGLGTVSADYASDLQSTGNLKGSGLVGWEKKPGMTVSDGLGKTIVSANDTAPGYLKTKLISGNGISIVECNDGGDETLTVSTPVSLSVTASTQASMTVGETDTDIMSGVSFGSVTAGAIYLLSGQARFIKGGVGGLTVVRILKESGSAEVRFDGKPADIPDVIHGVDTVPANLGFGFFLFGMLQVLQSGTLFLKMNAMSAGSSSYFGENQGTTASIQAIRLL